MTTDANSYATLSISGKHLTLRPYQVSDFESLQQSHKARLPEADKHDRPVTTATESDREKFKTRIQLLKAHAQNGVEFVFGVFAKESGEHIGEVGLLLINKQLRWGNIGYHIQNQFYGRGYASEAASSALQLAFRHLKFHRIEAGMELDHHASSKVARKIGLRFEGTRLKFFAADGGVDIDVYATNAIDFASVESTAATR